MSLVARIVFYALCGLIFGQIVDALGSLSVWFEMRVHIWQILLLSIVIWALAGVFIKRIYPVILYLLEIILFVVCAIFGRFNTIYFDLREIVNLGLSFNAFYLVVAAVTIAINLIVWRACGRK